MMLPLHAAVNKQVQLVVGDESESESGMLYQLPAIANNGGIPTVG